ncbi:MAG TPA: hypothetical protein VL181_07365 [Holophagaceae bacterium]|nr:hypothetical protein [Holophagaceae bacterium]
MNPPVPWLWIVAGINGAGKTTLCSKPEIKKLMGTSDILNPDIRTRALLAEQTELEIGEANLMAAKLTDAEVLDRIGATRTSFGVETVLSSDKFHPVLELARKEGWKVGLIYFALPSVDVAIERVKLRVLTGGHHVPEHKVRERWDRSIQRMARYLPQVDVGYIMGNPTAEGAMLLAEAKAGKIRLVDTSAIPWLTTLLQSMSADA